MNSNILSKFLVLGLLCASTAVGQDTLIGTYTINYQSNCAGIYTDQANPDYSHANPNFGNVIPPGPLFIPAPAGRYRFIVNSGAGCSIWSGDATQGTWHATGHNPGEIVTLNHTNGQIALYYWDWFPQDNDPKIQTTISVYHIEEVPIGTFTINYRSNCAGLYTDQGNPDYTQANPYRGNIILPGPVFLSVPPGHYEFVVESGAGCSIWSGDETQGTLHATGHNPEEVVTLNHTNGRIALYYWDWFPGDNDPSIQTTISVYRVGQGVLSIQMYAGLTLNGSIGASYDIQSSTDLSVSNWTTLEQITLTNTPSLYFDTNSPGFSRRFYRAILRP
jgi:hypothetical protein